MGLEELAALLNDELLDDIGKVARVYIAVSARGIGKEMFTHE